MNRLIFILVLGLLLEWVLYTPFGHSLVEATYEGGAPVASSV